MQPSVLACFEGAGRKLSSACHNNECIVVSCAISTRCMRIPSAPLSCSLQDTLQLVQPDASRIVAPALASALIAALACVPRAAWRGRSNERICKGTCDPPRLARQALARLCDAAARQHAWRQTGRVQCRGVVVQGRLIAVRAAAAFVCWVCEAGVCVCSAGAWPKRHRSKSSAQRRIARVAKVVPPLRRGTPARLHGVARLPAVVSQQSCRKQLYTPLTTVHHRRGSTPAHACSCHHQRDFAHMSALVHPIAGPAATCRSAPVTCTLSRLLVTAVARSPTHQQAL